MIRNDDKYSVFWIICLNSVNFDQIKVQRRIFSGSFIEIRYTVVEVTLNQRNLIWADMFETKKRHKKKQTKYTAASNLDCSTVYWTTWHSQVTKNKLMWRMSWEKRNWCMLVEGLSKRGIELPGYNKCIREIRGKSTLVLSIGSIRVIGL